MESLEYVRKIWPDAKAVVLAKKMRSIEVLDEDNAKAVAGDPRNCAAAIARRRECGGALDVRIGRRTSYEYDKKTKVVTKYKTSQPLIRETTSLDRARHLPKAQQLAFFSPGVYNLLPPSPPLPRGSGTRHAGDPRPGRFTHTYQHVRGVRPEMHELVEKARHGKKARPKKK